MVLHLERPTYGPESIFNQLANGMGEVAPPEASHDAPVHVEDYTAVPIEGCTRPLPGERIYVARSSNMDNSGGYTLLSARQFNDLHICAEGYKKAHESVSDMDLDDGYYAGYSDDLIDLFTFTINQASRKYKSLGFASDGNISDIGSSSKNYGFLLNENEFEVYKLETTRAGGATALNLFSPNPLSIGTSLFTELDRFPVPPGSDYMRGDTGLPKTNLNIDTSLAIRFFSHGVHTPPVYVRDQNGQMAASHYTPPVVNMAVTPASMFEPSMFYELRQNQTVMHERTHDVAAWRSAVEGLGASLNPGVKEHYIPPPETRKIEWVGSVRAATGSARMVGNFALLPYSIRDYATLSRQRLQIVTGASNSGIY